MRNTAKLFASALLLLAPTLAASCSNGTPTPTPIARPLSTSTLTHLCKDVDLATELKLIPYEGTEADFHDFRFMYPENWDISSMPALEIRRRTSEGDKWVWTAELEMTKEVCGSRSPVFFTRPDGSTHVSENASYAVDDPIQVIRYFVDGPRAGSNDWLRTLDDWSNVWTGHEFKNIQLKETSARLLVIRYPIDKPYTQVSVVFMREDSIYEIKLFSEDALLDHNLIIFQKLLDSLEFK